MAKTLSFSGSLFAAESPWEQTIELVYQHLRRTSS